VKRKRTIDIAPTVDSPRPCRVRWIAEQAQRLRLLGDVGGGLVIVAPSPARLPANPSTIEITAPSSRASEFARESRLWEQMARLGLKAADVEKPMPQPNNGARWADTAARGPEFVSAGVTRNKPAKSKAYGDQGQTKIANAVNDLANSAPVSDPETRRELQQTEVSK
jgi:hypothetical protein